MNIKTIWGLAGLDFIFGTSNEEQVNEFSPLDVGQGRNNILGTLTSL